MIRTTQFPNLCTAGILVLCLSGLPTRGDEDARLAMDPFGEIQSSQSSAADPENGVSSDEQAIGARDTELITERYPDGSVKIQREVTLDDENNYVNHGTYTMYDRRGNVARTGQYRMDKQHGEWMQIFQAGAGDLFAGDLNKQFSGPFVSVATFLDGQLNGTWTITGQDGKKVIQWSFDRGVRHGLATWWHPNGAKRWEVTYDNGVPVGERSIFGPDGQLTGTVRYVDGRPLVNKVKWYSKNRKAYEGTVLGSDDFDQKDFDWLTTSTKVDTSTINVPDVKHGAWISWHPNGVKRAEGNYERGLPQGKFTWWSENGQKQAEGFYRAGLKVGTWITWHDNGMKESQSNYNNDEYVGVWMRWEPSGRLVEMRDYDSNPAPKAVDKELDEQGEQQAGTETLDTEDVEVSQNPSRLSQLWGADADLE